MNFNGNLIPFNDYIMDFSTMNATNDYLQIALFSKGTGHQFSFMLAQFHNQDEYR